MQLVGYECRMWMPLDLSPSHNWLVNNLVPASSGTEPENSQATYSSCFLSSHFCPLHKHWGGCLCKHSLAETAILHVTASSCPCSSESLLIYFLEERGGEEWVQARELELQTKSNWTFLPWSLPTVRIYPNFCYQPQFFFTSGAFKIGVYSFIWDSCT